MACGKLGHDRACVVAAHAVHDQHFHSLRWIVVVDDALQARADPLAFVAARDDHGKLRQRFGHIKG